jgi:hypothetical protein
MCPHLLDTTSRYDAAKKLLTFVRFCPVCGTETVLETLPYEPNFSPGSLPREASVVPLPNPPRPDESAAPTHRERMEAA